MLKDLTILSQGKPLFVSDELSHYGTVLGELFHKLAPPSPTGKPARPWNPEWIIDADLDSATVHKTRQGAQVIKVERKVIHGSKKQVLARLGEVTQPDYQHCVYRTFQSGLAAMGRASCAKGSNRCPFDALAEGQVCHCVSCYNLIRPHETLSRGVDRIFRPKTPAMAATTADHQWTFSELLTYPALCQ